MRRLQTIDRAYNSIYLQPARKKALLNQTQQEGNVIFGGRSIQKQIGIFSRGTEDYDIFSKKPKLSAKKTEKAFDCIHGGDVFYTKPAMHPGTHKVMHKGFDGKKGTEDDYGVVDYSGFPIPKPQTVTVAGVKYRKLSQELKAKNKALRDPAFKFRHPKDAEDKFRINLARGKI